MLERYLDRWLERAGISKAGDARLFSVPSFGRSAYALAKTAYRVSKRQVPRRVRASPLLWPVRTALAFYRGRRPAAPESEGWAGGLPPLERAAEWRLEASRRHAVSAPEGAPEALPRIAALILNRNGAHHLEKLFESLLTHEDYPALTLWVIDHGSSDRSRAVLSSYAKAEDGGARTEPKPKRARRRLDVRPVLLSENQSFSESTNALARRADADLLLLLNNDIIFTEPVLGRLVRYLEDPGVGAAGLRLDFPKAHDKHPAGIQHAGIKFYLDLSARFLRPYNLSARTGVEVSGEGAERVPAVTGALLLCRRSDYLALGGLDEQFFYGYEDVDFCLRLRRDRGLKTVVVHELSAVHDESATQSRDPGAEVRARRARNQAALEARWGHALRTTLLADRLTNGRFWTDPPLQIGFAVTEAGPDARAGDAFTAEELATCLEAELGAKTRMLSSKQGDWYDVRGLDVVVAMVDRYDPRRMTGRIPGSVVVAWARNWFDRWADREWLASYDLVLVSSEVAARYMLDRAHRRADVLRLATHPTRFSRGRFEEDLRSDVCFTGSRWNVPREIEDNLRPETIEGKVVVFGEGWSGHDQLEAVARGFIPYERLPDVYASTRVVIDDANHATKPWGSVNSRVFDALAAGALVVTNGAVGADEVFGQALPTYDGPETLTERVNEALRDEAGRRARVDALRTEVLGKHTYRERAQRFGALLREVSATRLRFALKVPAPSHELKHQWGDWHFALALRRSLERLGHLVRVDLLPEWYGPPSLADDVVLVLRGLSRYTPEPRHVNLMWNISHPRLIEDAEYESYDHVFVASVRAAERLTRLKVPVSPLLQCTDPELFLPKPSFRAPRERVLFVGNSRRAQRPIVMDAVEADLPLGIYGGGWEDLVPASYVRAPHVPNEALHAYYRRAGVVLNDHWPDMRAHGFLSNRLFDAAASGAVVVSDPAIGLGAVFGDGVETYVTVDDLKSLVTRLLSSPRPARRKALALAERVRSEHSFDRRAEEIVRIARRVREEKKGLRI